MKPEFPSGAAAPPKDSFRDNLVAGLSRKPRWLSCKYFYDARGAALFQKICSLPEYYITRTEIGILRVHGSEIAAALGPGIELIGLGTGAGTKAGILLEELKDPVVYLPIDISQEQLQNSCARFRERFPTLEVMPVCADYLEPFELPLPRKPSARSVTYFPGSTIGNFEPDDAIEFMERLADLVGDGGGMVIGVDLRKDPAVLHAAYNDSAGVTAEFNLNVLARANEELGANFDLNQWMHRAVYNPDEGRIEMSLVSKADQTVVVENSEFKFAAGEEILTEYSYKHTPEGFVRLAHEAGFRFQKLWTDSNRLLGVFYFAVES